MVNSILVFYSVVRILEGKVLWFIWVVWFLDVRVFNWGKIACFSLVWKCRVFCIYGGFLGLACL